MLEEDPRDGEIVARVAALDIGKAEVVCCVRVPHEDKPGRRCQEVATYGSSRDACRSGKQWIMDRALPVRSCYDFRDRRDLRTGTPRCYFRDYACQSTTGRLIGFRDYEQDPLSGSGRLPHHRAQVWGDSRADRVSR